MTKTELEALVNGESVQKEINEELTYKELYASTENIWSALLMTGYLTKRGEADGKRYHPVVPNQEIRNIITEHILMRFREKCGQGWSDGGEILSGAGRWELSKY